MSRDFLMALRQAFLMIVDAIEREVEHKPRTAQLRDFYKSWKKENS